MKKILLGLGTMAVIIAPIVTVVSCDDEEETEAKTPTTNPPTTNPPTTNPPTTNPPTTTPPITLPIVVTPGVKIADLSTPKGREMKTAIEATDLFDTLLKVGIIKTHFPDALPQRYIFEGTKGGKKVILDELYTYVNDPIRKINGVILQGTGPQFQEFSKVMDALQENDELFSMS